MRRAAKILAALVGVALLSAAGLAAFNLAAAVLRRSQHPPLGNLYTIEGRSMHLYCVGSGSPTLLLESGGGDDLLYWQTIQPELAKTTRVCSYDRAGLGWSEPPAGEQNAEGVARRLHELLDAAGIQRPVVMAGASAGGYFLRVYALKYPKEVAGVAFLDASSPGQVDVLPGGRAWYDGEKIARPRRVKWDRLKVWSGWQRMTTGCHADVPKVQENLRAAYDAEECRPEWVGADVGEFVNFEDDGRAAGRLTSFGDLPEVVISQDPHRSAGPALAASQPIWEPMQENLKSMSTRSWRVIAKGASHHVHHDRPDVVVRELGRLVEFLRGGPAPAWGTTVTE